MKKSPSQFRDEILECLGTIHILPTNKKLLSENIAACIRLVGILTRQDTVSVKCFCCNEWNNPTEKEMRACIKEYGHYICNECCSSFLSKS